MPVATDSRPVVVPGQPLVTSADPNIVTPNAVSAMSDAFRQGFITSQDILDRLGETGQLARKAKIEQLKEIIDPQAIEARKAAITAGTAQAQLTTAQAGAELGLVPQMAELKRSQAEKAQVGTWHQKALEAADAWGVSPIYKTDAEGNPTKEIDVDATVDQASHTLRAQNLMQIAQEGLAATKVESKDPKTGQPIVTWVNKWGHNVTPSPDPTTGMERNKIRSGYMKMWQDSVSELHATPKGSALSMVSPKSSAAAATAAPVVTPAGAEESTAPSIPAGAMPGTTFPEVRQTIEGDSGYKVYAEKQDRINAFRKLVDEYKSEPEGVSRVRDLELANTVIQLLTPGSTPGGRGQPEFRVNRLEEAQPILERLANIKAELLGTEAYTPQTRARLIEAGARNAAEKENAARGILGLISNNLKQSGIDPADRLTANEMRLMETPPGGTDYSTVAPAEKSSSVIPASSATVGGTFTLQDGRKITKRADGKFILVK